ncbi:MAG: gluconate 2-dehydrogenase subunit 3 family protein [Deltaproteobacteria bacterium]|nr:gluconate 2-dehydrogenase subunit 3 family protein [Deltaproteobacteria bacterium]
MDDAHNPAPPSPGAFDRRSVLVGSLALAALAACTKDHPADAGPIADPLPPTTASASSKAKEAFVPVLTAIAERLLPTDDLGPGAKEADVAAFLGRVFEDQRLASVHPLLKRGAAFLMKAARLEGEKAFVDLDDVAKDDLLRRLGDNLMRPDGFHGPTFVRVMLALTLEGFLGDPRHGGNKGGLGWQVVGFSPESRAQGLTLKVLP